MKREKGREIKVERGSGFLSMIERRKTERERESLNEERNRKNVEREGGKKKKGREKTISLDGIFKR